MCGFLSMCGPRRFLKAAILRMRTFGEVRGDMSRVLGRLRKSRDSDERRQLLLRMHDLVVELDSLHQTGFSGAQRPNVNLEKQDLSIWVMARLLGFDLSEPPDPS